MQSCLVIVRRQTGHAPNPDMNVFVATITHGLVAPCLTEISAIGHSSSICNPLQNGMIIESENLIHHPTFEIPALNTSDVSVIINTEQNTAAPKVGEGHHFLRQLHRLRIIAFERDAGNFTICDQFE